MPDSLDQDGDCWDACQDGEGTVGCDCDDTSPEYNPDADEICEPGSGDENCSGVANGTEAPDNCE